MRTVTGVVTMSSLVGAMTVSIAAPIVVIDEDFDNDDAVGGDPINACCPGTWIPNKFTTNDGAEPARAILRVDPAIEQAQRDKLAAIRAERDSAKVSELLGHLESAAKGSDNLMPLFIECVEHDATLGEICDVFRTVFGEYKAVEVF